MTLENPRLDTRFDPFADTAHYAALIARRFPEVAIHSIEYLGDGWDFAAYPVNRE